MAAAAATASSSSTAVVPVSSSAHASALASDPANTVHRLPLSVRPVRRLDVSASHPLPQHSPVCFINSQGHQLPFSIPNWKTIGSVLPARYLPLGAAITVLPGIVEGIYVDLVNRTNPKHKSNPCMWGDYLPEYKPMATTAQTYREQCLGGEPCTLLPALTGIFGDTRAPIHPVLPTAEASAIHPESKRSIGLDFPTAFDAGGGTEFLIVYVQWVVFQFWTCANGRWLESKTISNERPRHVVLFAVQDCADEIAAKKFENLKRLTGDELVAVATKLTFSQFLKVVLCHIPARDKADRPCTLYDVCGPGAKWMKPNTLEFTVHTSGWVPCMLNQSVLTYYQDALTRYKEYCAAQPKGPSNGDLKRLAAANNVKAHTMMPLGDVAPTLGYKIFHQSGDIYIQAITFTGSKIAKPPAVMCHLYMRPDQAWMKYPDQAAGVYDSMTARYRRDVFQWHMLRFLNKTKHDKFEKAVRTSMGRPGGARYFVPENEPEWCRDISPSMRYAMFEANGLMYLVPPTVMALDIKKLMAREAPSSISKRRKNKKLDTATAEALASSRDTAARNLSGVDPEDEEGEEETVDEKKDADDDADAGIDVKTDADLWSDEEDRDEDEDAGDDDDDDDAGNDDDYVASVVSHKRRRNATKKSAAAAAAIASANRLRKKRRIDDLINVKQSTDQMITKEFPMSHLGDVFSPHVVDLERLLAVWARTRSSLPTPTACRAMPTAKDMHSHMMRLYDSGLSESHVWWVLYHTYRYGSTAAAAPAAAAAATTAVVDTGALPSLPELAQFMGLLMAETGRWNQSLSTMKGRLLHAISFLNPVPEKKIREVFSRMNSQLHYSAVSQDPSDPALVAVNKLFDELFFQTQPLMAMLEAHAFEVKFVNTAVSREKLATLVDALVQSVHRAVPLSQTLRPALTLTHATQNAVCWWSQASAMKPDIFREIIVIYRHVVKQPIFAFFWHAVQPCTGAMLSGTTYRRQWSPPSTLDLKDDAASPASTALVSLGGGSSLASASATTTVAIAGGTASALSSSSSTAITASASASASASTAAVHSRVPMASSSAAMLSRVYGDKTPLKTPATTSLTKGLQKMNKDISKDKAKNGKPWMAIRTCTEQDIVDAKSAAFFLVNYTADLDGGVRHGELLKQRSVAQRAVHLLALDLELMKPAADGNGGGGGGGGHPTVSLPPLPPPPPQQPSGASLYYPEGMPSYLSLPPPPPPLPSMPALPHASPAAIAAVVAMSSLASTPVTQAEHAAELAAASVHAASAPHPMILKYLNEVYDCGIETVDIKAVLRLVRNYVLLGTSSRQQRIQEVGRQLALYHKQSHDANAMPDFIMRTFCANQFGMSLHALVAPPTPQTNPLVHFCFEVSIAFLEAADCAYGFVDTESSAAVAAASSSAAAAAAAAIAATTDPAADDVDWNHDLGLSICRSNPVDDVSAPASAAAASASSVTITVVS